MHGEGALLQFLQAMPCDELSASKSGVLGKRLNVLKPQCAPPPRGLSGYCQAVLMVLVPLVSGEQHQGDNVSWPRVTYVVPVAAGVVVAETVVVL